MVRSQSRQIDCKTLSQKNHSQKRAGGVVQGVGPEFKPQYFKKNRIKIIFVDSHHVIGSATADSTNHGLRFFEKIVHDIYRPFFLSLVSKNCSTTTISVVCTFIGYYK
jgi:hypothetical protein